MCVNVYIFVQKTIYFLPIRVYILLKWYVYIHNLFKIIIKSNLLLNLIFFFFSFWGVREATPGNIQCLILVLHSDITPGRHIWDAQYWTACKANTLLTLLYFWPLDLLFLTFWDSWNLGSCPRKRKSVIYTQNVDSKYYRGLLFLMLTFLSICEYRIKVTGMLILEMLKTETRAIA